MITASLDGHAIWALRDVARTQARLDLIEDAILAGPGTAEWAEIAGSEIFANLETSDEIRRDPIIRRRTGKSVARLRTGFVNVALLGDSP